jgi:hypothetical protein
MGKRGLSFADGPMSLQPKRSLPEWGFRHRLFWQEPGTVRTECKVLYPAQLSASTCSYSSRVQKCSPAPPDSREHPDQVPNPSDPRQHLAGRAARHRKRLSPAGLQTPLHRQHAASRSEYLKPT